MPRILLFTKHMLKTILGCGIVFALAALALAAAHKPLGTKGQRYVSPDGTVSVSVIPVGKSAPKQSESLIEFRRNGGRLLCGIDYSSSDGEHGFGIVKGAWTPDSRYFVFSLASSGGHQSWHAPTQFYSRKTQAIRTLDDYLDGAGISNPDFSLEPPDTLHTEVWEGKDVPASVQLDSIGKSSLRRAKPFFVDCVGGRVLRVEEP